MRKLVAIAGTWLLLASVAQAGENWPTWRYDTNRTAASPHELPPDLNLLWKRELPEPRPSFPNDPRMCADRSYEPVAADDLLFVPSMIEDSVTAYHADDGAIAWEFFTGGPVRFAPVHWRGNLYFGSDDGYVYCVESGTGDLVWKKRAVPDDREDYRYFGNERCISRWPVRGAPLVHEGTLYFGSGVWPFEGIYVFAVDAETGRTKWVNDRIALIKDGFNDHGRQYDTGLPPLGYLAVIDGKLILTSGRCFPAFMDLETGELDPYTSGYGKFQSYPKGCWYATGIGDLFFCAGHTWGLSESTLEGRPREWVTVEEYVRLSEFSRADVEKMIDRGLLRTAKQDGKQQVYTGLPDGVTPVGFGHRNVTPNEKYFMENFHKLYVDAANRGREVGVFPWRVLTKDTVYFSEVRNSDKVKRDRGALYRDVDTGDRIVAEDLNRADWRITRAYGPWKWRNGRLIHWRYKRFKEKWAMDSSLQVHIKSGDHLYAGEPGRVAAVKIPQNGGKPRVAWDRDISGDPHRMLSAGSKLFVVTENGTIYCFGASEGRPKSYGCEVRYESADGAWARRVRGYLHDAEGPVRGYALVYGWHSGNLAQEIARQSDLHVVVLERDADVVDRVRRELAGQNVYGTEIHIIHADPAELKLSPNFAQLVASEKPLSAATRSDRKLTSQIMDILHPFCGKAYVPAEPGLLDSVKRHLGKEELSGYSVSQDGQVCRITRTAPPEGSAVWTHEAADAANTFATDEPHARGPFGVLWFSGAIDRHFPPGWDYAHNRNPYPVVQDGRMFILVANEVYAADIYTGKFLWKESLPETPKSQRRRAYHRKFSRPWDDNILVQDDLLYVFNEGTCHLIDPVTGKDSGTLPLPKEYRGAQSASWREIRMYDGRLFANIGSDLFCLDRHSGEVLWKHEGQKQHVGFAIGGDRVYCIDYYPPLGSPSARGEKNEAALYAVRADDGKVLWREKLQVGKVTEEEKTKAEREFRTSVLTLKPLVAYNAAHDTVLAIVNRLGISAWRGRSGERLWTRKLSRMGRHSLFGMEPPTVLKDQLIIDNGTVLDVKTGKPTFANIFQGKRGCGRVVANEHVLTFRDAHAAIVSFDNKTKQYLQCIRSGCTNGMLPVGGILTGLNTAHGCNCNWPLFLSFSLYHMPEASTFAPEAQSIHELDD